MNAKYKYHGVLCDCFLSESNGTSRSLNCLIIIFKMLGVFSGALLLSAASASLIKAVSSVRKLRELTEYHLETEIFPEDDSYAVLSCSANANPAKVDSCCAETFGGLLLSTQYWDTYTGLESQGQLLPPNQWTLHGMWPDFCNGSFTQYCDLNRQYDPRSVFCQRSMKPLLLTSPVQAQTRPMVFQTGSSSLRGRVQEILSLSFKARADTTFWPG